MNLADIEKQSKEYFPSGVAPNTDINIQLSSHKSEHSKAKTTCPNCKNIFYVDHTVFIPMGSKTKEQLEKEFRDG